MACESIFRVFKEWLVCIIFFISRIFFQGKIALIWEDIHPLNLRASNHSAAWFQTVRPLSTFHVVICYLHFLRFLLDLLPPVLFLTAPVGLTSCPPCQLAQETTCLPLKNGHLWKWQSARVLPPEMPDVLLVSQSLLYLILRPLFSLQFHIHIWDTREVAVLQSVNCNSHNPRLVFSMSSVEPGSHTYKYFLYGRNATYLFKYNSEEWIQSIKLYFL